MAHTEVLLLKPLENLGAEGDQVKVRTGYARNYLFPQKLAAPLTQANRKHVEALKKRRAEREIKEFEGAQQVAKQLEKLSVAFAVKTGEGGKMFGAVTAADLHQKIEEAGIILDKRKIHLHTPVKTLGKHDVKIKLHADVSIDFSFDVVSENPIETAAEEAPAGEVRKTEKKSARRKTAADEEAAGEEKPAKKTAKKKAE
ncbi:50S ribosomal protein L9 [Ereboglobus luteus]|uniref:Large ribosomal subunit protein bL9 n=1 Tax=Ereboglobus luteus TaxID=1796921 RepID=A0A2U8E0Q6_9BACT|nr:50S ribosomal protein L9 [Ereboglobus luteus]AWI08365.1 50S ribosomal protein L9 [Ereboglobus luteus]